MTQAPWMLHAWADLGVAEVPGSAHNRRIVEYARSLGQSWVVDDETPWCAAFVGACLEKAGVASTRSLAARSYAGWGVATDPTPGAVTVLSRGSDPAAGHVGFLVGWTEARVFLLRGNQSNAVTVAAFERSRVLAFRALRAASGEPPPVRPAADLFPEALAMVLRFEGGWSDDPFDPGGPTNKGITLATYARETGVEVTASSYGRLKAELRRIPDDLVRRIYRERYWKPCRAPDLPGPLALFHFDAAVNMGVPTAARMLQEALGVTVDGSIGPVTVAAARRAALVPTLERYADLRRRRYRSLSIFWRFGRGWLRRLDEALSRARALAAGGARQPSEQPSPAFTGEASTEPPGTGAPMTDDFPETERRLPESPAERVPVGPKWWGESLTIWGALLTGLTTVAPAVLAAFGIDLPIGLAQQLGRDVVAVAQAVGGLVGTLMTIVGRARASAPIERRSVSFRL